MFRVIFLPALLFASVATALSKPSIEARAITAPIIPGIANELIEITLEVDERLNLQRLLVASNTIKELTLRDENGEKVTSFEPGSYKLKLHGRIPAESDLAQSHKLDFAGLHFQDGKSMQVSVIHHFRPGYPIHRRGEQNCHTTRIPGIARTKKGTLLAVYDLRYNGMKDLQEHIDIGLSRSTDGGQTWEKPRPIMDMGEFGGKPQKENGCSDPNILVDPATGRIFVCAVWTHGKPGTHQWKGKGSEPGFDIHKSSQFMIVTSDDDGKTWSRPINATKKLKKKEWHLFAPAPGNGIVMRDGTLVIPTAGRDAEGMPFSCITWSRDRGQTWNVSEPARSNTNECAVVQLADGSLMLNMRDNRNRSDKSTTNGRAVSITRDLGKTWTTHSSDHGALPEPVCMASLIGPNQLHLFQKQPLLFSNPRNKHRRSHITIQASLDQGVSWPEKHHVLLDEGTCKGYSSLVMIDEKTVGILYESSRANLMFQKLPLAELVRDER